MKHSLRLRPDNADAHSNLGNILGFLGKFDEAVDHFQEALRQRPNFVGALSNLGNVQREQAKLDDALANLQKALRLDPGYAEAHLNLGTVLQAQGKLPEAAQCFQQAFRLKPDYDDAHLNLAFVWLLQGKFTEGWQKYDWRFKIKRIPQRTFQQPRWDGSPLTGKTILLHAEQGLGDTLQFIRYAPLVKERGGTVLLECPKELVRICKTCAGIDHIIATHDSLPPFDVQIPLMSLPAIFKTTLANVPAAIPYLSADAALTQHWQKELASAAKINIGIIWQGNPRFSQHVCRAADQRRSIPLAQFEPLARIPRVRLVSLQKGFGTEQLAPVKSEWGIVDLGDRLNDFMDTAAVMMNLDLIISADTAPLHMAGALGRPVWNVIPFAGCWRWLKNRSDSPWYPNTMKIYRQKKAGEWSEVFQRMAGEVQRMTGA